MTQVIILFIVFTPDGGIVNFLSLFLFPYESSRWRLAIGWMKLPVN